MSENYSALTRDGLAAQPVSMSSGPSRVAFLRKVYALMFSGLLAFFAATAIPLLGAMAGSEAMIAFCNFWIGLHPLLYLLLAIGGMWLAQSVSMKKGLNLVAFYSFAALFGFLSIGLVAYATAIGGPMILIQAGALTTFVFGGLTAYVFVTKKDFSFMGGFLSMGMMLLLGAVLIAIVGGMMGFKMELLSLAITLVSTILFSLYVLYDTSQIMNRYATDMVVPAALALMIDFIVLFKNILSLLSRSR